jgi:hypothetical protein
MTLTPKNWETFQHYKDRAPAWIKLHRGLLDNIDYYRLSPEAGKALPLIWLIASERDGIIPDAPELSFRLRISEDLAADILAELMEREFLVHSDAAEPAEQGATHAQRAAKSNGFGSRHISDATKRVVWDRDGGKCCACGSVKNIEYDHKHPVSKGGNSEESNIQLLCRPCNRAKRVSVATPAQPLRSPEKRDIEQNIDKRERQKETREVALSVDPNEFHNFWEEWPNKVGKPAAVKALASARKRGAAFDAIMAGVQNYIRDKPPDRPWLNPATFLNQNRWEDQPAKVQDGKTESLGNIARRQAEGGISFGERPTGLRIVESGSDVRLLSEAGRE